MSNKLSWYCINGLCCWVYDRQDGFLRAGSGNAARRVGETEKKGGATETEKGTSLFDTVESGHARANLPLSWFFVLLWVFVFVCSLANRQRTVICIFVYCTSLLFLPAGNRWNNSSFRTASRQLATCGIQCLIFISCLFLSSPSHVVVATFWCIDREIESRFPFGHRHVIYCVETIGRSAELNSFQPVVHHLVESARPAWQDPVYVSKLVDIVCIRVNWPVILSVEWSAISRHVFVHLCVTICLSTLGRVVSRSTTPFLFLYPCELACHTLRRVVSHFLASRSACQLSVEWSADLRRHL